MRARPGVPTLGRRALGRATLHRQLLLEPSELDVAAALEHLAGLQAQVPTVPYTALWSRLRGFEPESLSALMAKREVVRSLLMRGTIHTVTAADCLGLWPVMAPVLARAFAGTGWAKSVRGHDLGPPLAAARNLVEERPRSRAELARELEPRFPHLDATALAAAFSYLEPLVQPTPRGLWGRSAAARLTTTTSWLGRPLQPFALDDVVRRYLTAFGPASVLDIQAWCGLTRLREVTDRMDLRRFRTEDGAELLDLPDAPLPDPSTPAPVRFLPEYDNALLSFADRSRVIADADHVWLQAGPGGAVGSVLVDGLVSATWALRRPAKDAAAELEVRLSLPLAPAARVEVTEVGEALAAFLAPDGEVCVRLTEPDQPTTGPASSRAWSPLSTSAR